MKISLIIPAYNEQDRIGKTLRAYYDFFSIKERESKIQFEIVVVINGTTDSTEHVVQEMQETRPMLHYIVEKAGGKGLAIKKGFENALQRSSDVIGFVDADMATSPEAFYQLIEVLNDYDGIIASRYMPGAIVIPARPLIKRLGSKILFESTTKILFGLRYYDTQCGAKVFKRKVIETIVPYLSVRHWAFDVELLYLCKKNNFSIYELPTQWADQTGSKLRMFSAGMQMLKALVILRWKSFYLKK